MKRIMLIEDISCYGKCSMTVALPIFSVSEIEVVPLPTAVFSAHTGVGASPAVVDFGENIEDFFSQFKGLNLNFDAILVGYSLGERQLGAVDAILGHYKTEKKPIVLVDPAMADHGKLYGKLSKAYPEKMKNLAKKADIITPNLTEALLLAERDCTRLTVSPEEVKNLLETLNERYQAQIVITGIQMEDELMVAGLSRGQYYEIKTERVERNYSGTGDAFASLFLAGLLRGKEFEASMKEAANLTSLAVKNSMEKGLSHLYFESILREIG